MDDLEEFRAFYELADRLIRSASKEDVAEAARLLAPKVAHYQIKYGTLPLENFADLLRAESIDPQTAKLLSARCWTWAMVQKMIRCTRTDIRAKWGGNKRSRT
jgi:hypothetical protein